ncbi:MAG: hypothetical protein VW600_14235, partial [Ferrovibrio sp.]
MQTNPFDDDKLHEECGIFGIFGTSDAAANTVLGLHALQHRGQEAAGIVAFNEGRFNSHRALGHVAPNFSSEKVIRELPGDRAIGHVAPNFSSEKVIRELPGDRAIGHVRYSTSGGTLLRNVQPIYADLELGGIALAHNGNLTNARHIRDDLVAKGSIFQSTMDTEVITHLVALSRKTSVVDRIVDALKQIEGAYALVALTPKKL